MRFLKFICFILFLLISSCIQNKSLDKAREESDYLIEKIAIGKANNAFPEKYFPRSQTELLMDELKNKCDFANRKGVFINDFHQKGTGYERISFIYEFYLKCDSIRFILTYNLGEEIELYEFKLEPIEKDNPMITKPERRLKF